jgi:hypothetical protein
MLVLLASTRTVTLLRDGWPRRLKRAEGQVFPRMENIVMQSWPLGRTIRYPKSRPRRRPPGLVSREEPHVHAASLDFFTGHSFDFDESEAEFSGAAGAQYWFIEAGGGDGESWTIGDAPAESEELALGLDTDREQIEAPCPEIEGIDLEVTESARFNRNVAGLSVVAGFEGPFATVIDWGDGISSKGTALRDEARVLVSGQHLYSRHGTFVVTTWVRAGHGRARFAASKVKVHDAGIQAGGHFVRARTGREFTGTVAHFRDQNPFSQLGDFSSRIRWSDGSTSVGFIVPNLDGGYDVLGTHTFLAPGRFWLDVSIQSIGGSLASARASARVVA